MRSLKQLSASNWLSTMFWVVVSMFSATFGCAPSQTPSQEQTSTSTSFLTTGASTSAAVAFDNVTVANDHGVARFDGLPVAGKPGQPLLPMRIVRLLLDPQADLSQISVAIEGDNEVAVSGTYQIGPARPPIAKDRVLWPANANIVDGKDMDVYGKNAFFPASHLGTVSTGRLGAYQIVEVPVFPYQYNPRTGELRQLLSGRVVVTSQTTVFGTASAAAAAESAVDQGQIDRVRALVDNFDEAISSYRSGAAPLSATAATSAATAGGYVIVSTEAIRAASTYLAAFADAKVSAGFAVELITGTTDYQRTTSKTWTCAQSGCTGGWGGGTGDTAANNIRQWLSTNHTGHNVAYVLLVGNPNPATGDVPMKDTLPFGSESSDLPTDFYYAELSGNWDLDGDGVVAEYPDDYAAGGADKYAELSVGRIPFYGSYTDLDHILAKTAIYGQTSNISWRKKALLATYPLDPDTPGYQLAEQIRTNVLIPNGWGSFRIYDQDYGVSPELTPTTPENVRDSWLSFKPGLTVWMTHGSNPFASAIMDVQNAALLDDVHPAFVYHGSCDNAYPEDPVNLAYSLLLNGAVGTIAATRVSYYNGGQTNFEDTGATVGSIGRDLAGYLVSSLSAGDALRSTQSYINIDGVWWWWNDLVFNLYGDPSVGTNTSGTGATAPPTPTGLTASPADAQVTLTWTPVTTAGGYTIRRATTAGGPYTVVGSAGASARYVDTTATPAIRNYYVISAVNIAGESSPSAEVSAIPTAHLQVLYMNPDYNAIDGWIRPQLQIVNTSTTAPLPLSVLTIRYWFTEEGTVSQGYACDYAVLGTSYVSGRFVRLAAPMTGADTYLELSFAAGAPSLAPGDNSGDIQSRFWKTDWSSYNEANDYSYAAQRTYAAVTHITAYWNGQLVWGTEPLQAPSGVAATAGNAQASISWNTVTGATTYSVKRATVSGGPYTTVASNVTATTYVMSGLTNGSTYYIMVSASNAAGEGPNSAQVSVKPSGSLPVQVIGLRATAGNGQVTLSWNAASGATSYSIKRATSANGPFTTIGTSTTSAYTARNLTNGTPYYFQVAGVNSSGQGLVSTVVTATPHG